MNTERIATRQTPLAVTYNVGQTVLYVGVYLRIEATIIALDVDKRGNRMALLKPVSGVNMWRELGSIRPMGAA